LTREEEIESSLSGALTAISHAQISDSSRKIIGAAGIGENVIRMARIHFDRSELARGKGRLVIISRAGVAKGIASADNVIGKISTFGWAEDQLTVADSMGTGTSDDGRKLYPGVFRIKTNPTLLIRDIFADDDGQAPFVKSDGVMRKRSGEVLGKQSNALSIRRRFSG